MSTEWEVGQSKDCKTILQMKNIISDYCNDASNHYLDSFNDLNNPLFLLPEKLENVNNVLDVLYSLKQAKLN